MDTKIINAYNEKNEKLVGSGLLIVDAAVEPLKVLKVLVEGLPDGRSGLWLTNFKGIPVARTLSPFDLIYLDVEYRVVHCVEISVEGEYEPFRGEPASALVVPTRSISSSKLRAGDRLMFRTVDAADTVPQASTKSTRASRTPAPLPAPSAAPSGGHFYNSSFPLPSGDGVMPGFLGQQQGGGSAPGATASADQGPTAQSAQAAISGRLSKTANSVLGNSPAFRPSAGDELRPPQPELGAASLSTVQSPPPVEVSFSVKAPTRLMSPPPGASAASSVIPSGRLMRSVNLAPAILPAEEPEHSEPVVNLNPGALTIQEVDLSPAPAENEAVASAAPAVLPEKPREPSHGIVIPITSAPHYIPVHDQLSATVAPQPAVQPPAVESRPADVVEPAAQPSTQRSTAEPVLPALAATSPAAEPAALSVTSPQAATPRPIVQAPQIGVAQPAAASAPATFYEPAASVATTPLQVPQPSPAAAVPAAHAQPQNNVEPDAAPAPVTAIQPYEPSPYPRTQIKPAERHQALEVSRQKQKPSWDVRLLYSLFPEFDPSRPPEIRIPRMGEERERVVEDEEQMPAKLRFLCWLYPDLHLEKVKEKRGEVRRAVRLPMPGLVAYFFTGGAPRPHPIKDISVTGFYMCTTERWLPGTIIRVTLQMIDPGTGGGRDSVTVHSRVVRWGPDGGGFEFVLPGFLEDK